MVAALLKAKLQISCRIICTINKDEQRKYITQLFKHPGVSPCNVQLHWRCVGDLGPVLHAKYFFILFVLHICSIVQFRWFEQAQIQKLAKFCVLILMFGVIILLKDPSTAKISPPAKDKQVLWCHQYSPEPLGDQPLLIWMLMHPIPGTTWKFGKSSRHHDWAWFPDFILCSVLNFPHCQHAPSNW